MAPASAFTPKASLTDAPTNLKEAIDWVLRVTGKDGKKLGDGECICGLAAAVTDLLQSVQLEYNGYQGDTKETGTDKGASDEQVKCHLNGLFSLVQGLGGTAVVRTYIDQLAQVLSALVGWSKIEKCWDGGCNSSNNNQHGTKDTCKYLLDKEPENKCGTCGCMKWNVKDPNTQGTPLGRRCTRCKDNGGSDACNCGTGGPCEGTDKCKCALAGKCCKCCCKGKCNKCGDVKDRKCRCDKEKKDTSFGDEYHKDSYMSAYPSEAFLKRISYVESIKIENPPSWKNLDYSPPDKLTNNGGTITDRRHKCARILLGSVCLIWSGITYMYWTGKYHSSSPRWNNHILDGSGLDDGSLSQWLQALGFPRDMLNNHGPRNRWDAVIWDGFRGMLYLGFPDTGNNSNAHGHDNNANTFRQPAGMNYAGYIHTLEKGAFCSKGNVFKKAEDASTSEENIHKCGALYKLYILSCAYFTGLQKRNSESTPRTPRTIREILYWLSALPYSKAYPEILKHGKNRLREVTQKPGESDISDKTPTLAFHQTGRNHPITVHEFNLFAHFQAVTQYCPLVLIGIQGGFKGTDNTKEPAIHSLYANTECSFTYPTVPIQAYNQVVHYIRALFYQLYFLRKQCAVKVALGGKWRECRYGDGVLGKDVVSWMCLGCNPMDHDRKSRVDGVKKTLDGVPKGKSGELTEKLKELLKSIGDVVIQLGNAQEALEGKAESKVIEGVKGKLGKAKGTLGQMKNGTSGSGSGALEDLDDAVDGGLKTKLEELTKNGGGGILKELETKLGTDSDRGKNALSSAIHKVLEVLELIKGWAEEEGKNVIDDAKKCLGDDVLEVTLEDQFDIYKKYSEMIHKLQDITNDLISICTSPKCSACDQHSTKCGRQPQSKYCDKCHQQYNDGFPSPLQAFLEDRLPGFSCKEVPDTENPEYPPAASHLRHCGGSGQCCPLPMGFRGQFHEGSIRDCTGQRLYGILYFFSNGDMMQSCVYTLVRVTAALSATTPQVLGDVFGFFRGGVGEKDRGKTQKGEETSCEHTGNPSESSEANKSKYFCGWCASGLREEVKKIEWIQKITGGDDYRESVGKALRDIKGSDSTATTTAYSSTGTTTTSLSALTKDSEYLSPLTGELYTAVSATFGNTYLSWVLYLSDALHWGLQSLSEAFQQIECRGCRDCDPNKCKKGSHGGTDSAQCNCSSIVSCTGVLPVLYRHGFSYGNPFNLEGYQQKGMESGDYSITDTKSTKKCHQFLDSLSAVIKKKEKAEKATTHPLTELLKQVGKLQYDIRLPWIFVLTLAWLVAVLYLAFGAIWPLDWTHMRSHWLRGGEHQWQCMWYKVMTGRKGMELVEYFERR